MDSAGSAAGTITFTGSAGSSSNLTTYNITLACGDGGDMIIGVNGHNGGRTISSWTIGGQTVTTKVTVMGSSESTVALGTASGVGSGNQTMSITWSGSQLRTMTFGWSLTGVDIVTAASIDTDAGFVLSIPTIPAGGVAAAFAGTGSGTGFTGSTGLIFDGNQSNESNASGASDAFKTEQTSLAVTFTGAGSSQPASVALALSPG